VPIDLALYFQRVKEVGTISLLINPREPKCRKQNCGSLWATSKHDQSGLAL
jgi:hypothetical protein